MVHSPYAIGRLILAEMDRQQLSSADFVRQRLGYSNVPRGVRRLERLIRTGFDPVLISRIAGALFIDHSVVDEAMMETESELARESDEERERDDEYRRMYFRPHIVVETDRLGPQGLFGKIAFERMRRIPISDAIIGMTLDDQIASLRRIVVEHFVRNGGQIDAFGEIRRYVFIRSHDDAVSFDVDGRVLNYFERPVEVRPRLGQKRRSAVNSSRMSDPWSAGCIGVGPSSLLEGDDHVAP